MLPVKLEFINMGKIEREYRGLIGEYERRIKSLAHVSFLQKDEIPREAILLDEKGETVNSEDFYNMLKNFSAEGKKMVFVIGPPEGFSFQQREVHRCISLSSLTLRHELAYLVLLEQVYRALLRMKGTSYQR